ncbi:MAG: ferrous iron transport protein B [Firmicutes bacterium]|nr:ferrous iron transport protein B [Bacillota bacterium]
MTLDELRQGVSAVIVSVGGEGAHRQHFLDMGVIPGASLTMVKPAPMGDPIEFRIHGYELTLRLEDAAKIEISIEEPEEGSRAGEDSLQPAESAAKGIEHPGLGEFGKSHATDAGEPVPPGTVLRFALAGNQNSGKTTLFNQLTGSNQHVGNFPGVTVDRKSGQIKGYPDTELTDLPGIYSLSPYTEEEVVSRDYIVREKPHGIINILDATSIERGLYLTMQLIELGIPMVLALNMMDELEGNGGSIDINLMEKILGIPVIPISAIKGQGISELTEHAVHVARFREKPGRIDFCDEKQHGGAVHRSIHAVSHLISDHAEQAGLPVRFTATDLLSGNTAYLPELKLTQNEDEMLEHICVQMEEERGLDRSAAIADMRFSFIQKLVKATVRKPRESKERIRSEKLDSVLTGKHTAIPVFVLIMAAVFYLTFGLIGVWLQDMLAALIDRGAELTADALAAANVSEGLTSLIIDGIFAGVGSVLSFLPVIVVLFFFLSLLEDTGYMARVAFLMDRPLRKLGLSGRSIVPLLIGFGCSVPGVMASRTMPSERDRKLTVMLIPFMSCTAKLPIYGFLTAAFFPEHSGLIIVGLYLLSMLTGILYAVLLKNTMFRGEAIPFVMELPNYRMPSAKNVLQLLWEKAKDFIERAFTIIFMASIVIWFTQSFDMTMHMTDDSSVSILAVVSGIIAPVFAPLGLGDWRFSTAIITGLLAKESVVSTLEILFGEGTTIAAAAGLPAGAALLVFCLLYTPCVAAIAAVKRELGGKWAAGIVAAQCAIAWLAALIVKLLVAALI